MMPMKKLGCLLLILSFSLSTIGIVYATAGSLEITPGNQAECNIPASSGDTVQITFTITDDYSNSMLSWIIFPNSTIMQLGDIGQYSANFKSNAGGTYQLHFNNTSSSETVLVSLNYEVDHYILGMPEMIFVLAAIVVLLMFIVAGYIIMSKYPS